jgi:hypothetical protein
MKWFFPLLICCFLWNGQSRAESIRDLLKATARQPGYEVSAISVQESVLEQEATASALFLRLSLFGRAEDYNSPVNLRPMPPTEVDIRAGEAIPFSREILRYGLRFEVPIYIRKIYVLRQKWAILRRKAEIDRRLDWLGREASVVSMNAALTYFEHLANAVTARRKSWKRPLRISRSR